MKPDERTLLLTLAAVPVGQHVYVRGVVAELGMNENRAAYLCNKWTKKGWYNWGVNVLAGWLTDKGREVAEKEENQSKKVGDA